MARLGGIDTQYFDDEGFPLSYGKLYCYETGTTTPKGTFHDTDLTVPNTWPVELDAIGVPPDVFFSGTAKFVLKDSAGTTLRTLDPVIDNEFETGDTIILRLGDIDSQFFDQNGEILSLGKLYVYENGTSTPKNTYSDNALTSLNSWPVVLDSVGFLGDVFYEGKARLVLTDQNGVQQRELDNVDTFDISYIPGIIVECPSDTVVMTGEVVTFCVYVEGSVGDYTYQWYQDMTLLVGETGHCLTKTIVSGDDGTRLWVTVSDGESQEQCGYALITINDTVCVWTAPASPITAELIWSEEDGGIPTTAGDGILGTDGAGRIIAYPTANKIIVSDDFGDTWTTYSNGLPDSNSSPGAAYLEPTSWQYFEGKWRSHLNEVENNASNGNAYAADFNAGVWTFGEWNDHRGAPPTYDQVGLRNGRYTSSCMYWDENGLVVGGRWGPDALYPGTDIGATFTNYIAYARYASNTGDNNVPPSYMNIADNDNVYKILPLSDGYFVARWDGARMNGDWISTDLASFESNGRDSLGSVITRRYAGNGDDIVIAPRSVSLYNRWYKGQGTTIESLDPNLNAAAGGEQFAGYSPQHWLYVSGNTNKLWTSYCESPDGDVFIEGPTVTLPDTISSSSLDFKYQDLVYAGSGVWIGCYIRTVDRKVDIYRFTYGTLTGNCD